MSVTDLSCWNCGAELTGVPLPVGRGEECPKCVASVRACRMCRFYDPEASNACREPMADAVADKERANTCDYFTPRPQAAAEDRGEAEQARAKLEAIFGNQGGDLGGKGAGLGAGLAGEAEAMGDKSESEAQAARRKLEEMFGKKGD